MDYATGTYPEDLEQQIHNAFNNLKATLEGAGSSIEKVLKVLLFISDGLYINKINEIYQQVFVSRPARSCVIVLFPNKSIMLELECVAEAI